MLEVAFFFLKENHFTYNKLELSRQTLRQFILSLVDIDNALLCNMRGFHFPCRLAIKNCISDWPSSMDARVASIGGSRRWQWQRQCHRPIAYRNTCIEIKFIRVRLESAQNEILKLSIYIQDNLKFTSQINTVVLLQNQFVWKIQIHLVIHRMIF